MRMMLAAALGSALMVAPAQAALVLDYQLNGSLADALGGADIINNGGSLGPAGISFEPNQGPTIGGFSNTGVYSIVVEFSFGAYGGYQKILDFQNRSSDLGLYALDNSLNFYNFVTGPSDVFVAGQLHQLVLTRSEDLTVTGYLDGVSMFSFVDNGGDAVIQSSLALFQDDATTGFGEARQGFVNLVQVHDVALAANQLPGFGAVVPEPESWALMILGFGLVGVSMRRRVALTARG